MPAILHLRHRCAPPRACRLSDMKIIAAVLLLLTTADRWRAVGEGVTIAQADNGVRASYRVVSGKPSGAALPVPPGTLAGVKTIRVRITANRNTSLIVSLQDRKGVAYSFPSIAARAGTRTVELSVDDLSFLPQQSKGADPGSFDVAEAVVITVIDISGFMSAETPEVTWTIESLEGVR